VKIITIKTNEKRIERYESSQEKQTQRHAGRTEIRKQKFGE